MEMRIVVDINNKQQIWEICMVSFLKILIMLLTEGYMPN